MENICVIDIYGVVWSVCLLYLRLVTIFSVSFLVRFGPPRDFLIFKIQFHLARPMERTVLTVSAGWLFEIQLRYWCPSKFILSVLSYKRPNDSPSGPTPKRCQISANIYPVYSKLPSIPGFPLLHPQPQVEPSMPSRDPVNVKFLGTRYFVVSNDASVR
jgi:hypothetical protein